MGPSLMVHDQNTNNLIILENVPGGEIWINTREMVMNHIIILVKILFIFIIIIPIMVKYTLCQASVGVCEFWHGVLCSWIIQAANCDMFAVLTSLSFTHCQPRVEVEDGKSITFVYSTFGYKEKQEVLLWLIYISPIVCLW
jgi:hypothetical protein